MANGEARFKTRVALTYFKPTGRYYTEGAFVQEFDHYFPVGLDDWQCYMPDVISAVRGRRDAGGQGALPGIQGEWKGPILIAVERCSYTHLLMPKVVHAPTE